MNDVGWSFAVVISMQCWMLLPREKEIVFPLKVNSQTVSAAFCSMNLRKSLLSRRLYGTIAKSVHDEELVLQTALVF